MASEIIVHGKSGQSRILIGGKLIDLASYLPPSRSRLFVVTDANVRQLYAAQFPADATIVAIGQGEGEKTLATVEGIYRSLIAAGADRRAFVVGIGGGIVCDVAGFAASTYMRGLDFGFVASTLLAQVDASVGGKNGVNLDRYKNVVGCFNQPRFVICDGDLLVSLSRPELCCGFAEIVKHMLIADAPMLDWLEAHVEEALNLERTVVERLVEHSVRIKAAIVNRDEKENGERRRLNFGHTLGHAIEKLTGVPHGHAVSLGMVAAAKLSSLRGLLTTADVDRIAALLSRLGLPTRLETPPNGLMEAMSRDKKREGDEVHFVLLDGLGRAVVEKIAFAEIAETLAQMV